MQRLLVGDLVQVMRGKDKGKQGRITKLLRDEDKVIVEGLNMVVRHQKPSARNEQGGRIQKEAPLRAASVMPIDPTTNKPTRVRTRVEGDKKIRIAKSDAKLVTG